MNNDEQLFFKIEDYLTGKLPPDVAAAFEREITADPELAETVEMQRFEREGLEFMMEQKLRADIESWKTAPPRGMDVPPPDSTKSPGGQRFRWTYLIVLLLLGLAGVFLFKNRQKEPAAPELQGRQGPSSDQAGQNPPAKLSSDSLVPIAHTEDQNPKKSSEIQPVDDRYAVLAYAEHEMPENLGGGLRGSSGSGQDNVLTPAVNYFSNKPPDFKNAIAELKKINKQNHPEAFDLAQEMLAHAYFKNRQYDKAAGIFGSMAKQNLSATAHDQAEWYLVLSLLPDYPNQKTRVDPLLKKMTDPKSFHSFEKSAVELKNKLQNIGR